MTAELDEGATGRRWTPPKLSRQEWVLIGVTLAGAVAVGLIGFYTSFKGVSDYLATRGFPHAWTVPTATDIAIPVFTVLYLVSIRLKVRIGWMRWVPPVLTAVTIYLNIVSVTDVASKLAHVALPALWIALTEAIAKVYKRRIGVLARDSIEGIPLKRWFLSPLPTLLLWRRMHLWEIRSYEQALRLDQDRIRVATQMRLQYGRLWRYKVETRVVRMEMGLGTNLEGLLAAASGQITYLSTQASPAIAAPTTKTAPTQLPEPASLPKLPAVAGADRAETALNAVPTAVPTTLPAPRSASPRAGDRPYTAASTVTEGVVSTALERAVEEEQTEYERNVDADMLARVVVAIVRLSQRGERISGPNLALELPDQPGARTAQRRLKNLRALGVTVPDTAADPDAVIRVVTQARELGLPVQDDLLLNN